MEQFVYGFGLKDIAPAAGDKTTLKNLLGGKGANLAEMAAIGLPVPAGFTITTAACTHYYKNNKSYPQSLKEQALKAVTALEKTQGLGFGDKTSPLLVSVRSGARVSMPGMMDTILNLGLNDETVKGLEQISKDARFAWDSYRRFIQMYASVVLNVSHHEFEDILEDVKSAKNYTNDTELSAADWQDVVTEYKELVEQQCGKPFPQDVNEQLWQAISAVFNSWQTPRAATYRRIHSIPEDWGTAVNVQSMVFGNRGDDCATGVAFTRDPSSGENYFYGEFLINAQGEDVVAGIRTPQPLSLAAKQKGKSTLACMEEVMPEVYAQLDNVREILEKHYKDMQDIEFTVERGKLFMLQTRSGKRTAAASLKIAVDMVAEKLIDKEEALLRIDAHALDQLLHPQLDAAATKTLLAKGLPASPGAASGKAVFTADEAEDAAGRGEKVILIRAETSPEDIHGMHAATGIITSRGGMTSHAAVVARGMGRPCVAGAGDVHIDAKAKQFTANNITVKEGEYVTIDGAAGAIYHGLVPTIEPKFSQDLETVLSWADETARLKVRANAETPLDAKTARHFGAQGIGLCRTEHMFFDETRIQFMREMIFAGSKQAREDALAKLQPFQQADFESLFEIMAGLPVTIRLLDPPLHEFLPQKPADIENFAKKAGLDLAAVQNKLEALHEANPMLGHRGCRLAITYPEIYDMQVRAIFEAAKKCQTPPILEIMVPLVMDAAELKIIKDSIDSIAAPYNLNYSVGTMIELPRAALMADKIAGHAAFFSFGTNDLTQTTLGISRDDAGRFLPEYTAKNIFTRDPFVTLDTAGVGTLIKMASLNGKATNANLKTGICGEHGGDPASIHFCDKAGLNYVSCSPYRVPLARLAAAQSTIQNKYDEQQESLNNGRKSAA